MTRTRRPWALYIGLALFTLGLAVLLGAGRPTGLLVAVAGFVVALIGLTTHLVARARG